MIQILKPDVDGPGPPTIIDDDENSEMPNTGEQVADEEDDDDNDDDVPLANMKSNESTAGPNHHFVWRKVCYDPGDITFKEVPTEPIPDDTTTPYQYFKTVCD